MTQSPPPVPDLPPAVAADRDPVTGLRRMSRTAGVGLHDYAAINTLAVIALVLGPASLLVFFGSFLLIVPIVGVACAALAVRQIRRSSGTETGLPLALIGGALSAGLLAWAVGSGVIESGRNAADRAQIESVAADLAAALSAGDYDAAYALFHERFQENVPRDRFESALAARQSSPYHGTIAGLRLSEVMRFERESSEAGRIGQGTLMIDLPPLPGDPGATRPAVAPPPRTDRQTVVFREQGGAWKILNVGDWFAPPPGAEEPGG